jgi:hypothetical protein
MIFSNGERNFHFHKVKLIILYVGLRISRMVTLDLGKFADVT